MQTLFEAASHIAQEIERTRQHLINLEQALEGLKPLITVDAATTTLTYIITPETQPVEDLSVVNAAASTKKKSKARPTEATKEKKAEPLKPKSTKAKATEPEVQAEPLKLPATGAELWLKCIGRKKMTIAQIAEAALKKLKLDASAKEVMATRAKAWAYQATKKGVLTPAGSRDGAKLYQWAPAKAHSPQPSLETVELNVNTVAPGVPADAVAEVSDAT